MTKKGFSKYRLAIEFDTARDMMAFLGQAQSVDILPRDAGVREIDSLDGNDRFIGNFIVKRLHDIPEQLQVKEVESEEWLTKYTLGGKELK